MKRFVINYIDINSFLEMRMQIDNLNRELLEYKVDNEKFREKI